MSETKSSSNIIEIFKRIPLQVIQFVSGAAVRIFSPVKDDYPATGIQPYEGDPADEHSH